jgi:hypothetical protein
LVIKRKDIATSVQPWFGDQLIENYTTVLTTGKKTAGGVPVGQMMANSLIMAVGIVVGKIVISIISAFAIVYFRFPLRMFFLGYFSNTDAAGGGAHPADLQGGGGSGPVEHLYRPYTALDCFGDSHFFVPPVFFDGAGRTVRGCPRRWGRSHAFFSDHPAAAGVCCSCDAASFCQRFGGNGEVKGFIINPFDLNRLTRIVRKTVDEKAPDGPDKLELKIED